jgi:glycerophosphoryl diester phosphodiesterase
MRHLKCGTIAVLTMAVVSIPAEAQTFKDQFRTIVHRGIYLETNPKYTEDTIPAFERAQELGWKAVEVDVRMTTDRIPIMMHDPCGGIDRSCAAVGRTTNIDNNGGLLTNKKLMPPPNRDASLRPSPRGISLARIQDEFRFFKVYDVYGNLVTRSQEKRLLLADLLEQIRLAPTGRAAKLTYFLDIQGPGALDATQDLLAAYYNGAGRPRFNFYPMVKIKLWTTAFEVDCIGNPVVKTPKGYAKYWDDVWYSVNSATLRSVDPNYTTVTRNCNGSLSEVSYGLSTIQSTMKATYGKNVNTESFIAGNGNPLDGNVVSKFKNPSFPLPKPQIGVTRYYDARYGFNFYTCSADTCARPVSEAEVKARVAFSACHAMLVKDVISSNHFGSIYERCPF